MDPLVFNNVYDYKRLGKGNMKSKDIKEEAAERVQLVKTAYLDTENKLHPFMPQELKNDILQEETRNQKMMQKQDAFNSDSDDD